MNALALFSLFCLAQVPQYTVECDPDQFQYMMDNYEEEIVIPCTVEHQGTVYENCTMRIRGDTSRAFRKNPTGSSSPLISPISAGPDGTSTPTISTIPTSEPGFSHGYSAAWGFPVFRFPTPGWT